MGHKILFVGTDQFSLYCLNKLVQAPRFVVKGVVTQPARRKGRGLSLLLSPVEQGAKALGLPIWTPNNLTDPIFLDGIKSLKADGLVLLSYGKILPPAFLDLFPNRAMNVHASLLPRWRGAAPVQRALMAGDKKVGISLQVMTAKLDKGPVVSTKSFDLTNNMDAFLVFEKMKQLLPYLLEDIINYMAGKLKAYPQEEEEGRSTYAYKIDKAESRVLWDRPAKVIFNQIRALVMGPQAWALYKGKRLKFLKASFVTESASKVNAQPGQVILLNKEGFRVACQTGFIDVLKVQPESKKQMSADVYVRGYGLKVGDFFT